MSDEFDPYHRWLGIAPEFRPPDHYQLLGIPQFESDLDVIASAADRQMMHVRSFQNGKHAAWTQRILNELAAARVCLLSREQKSRYDEQLRGAPQPEPVAEPRVTVRTASPSRPRRRRPQRLPTLVWVGVTAGLAVGIVATVLATLAFLPRHGTLLLQLPTQGREQMEVTIDGRPRTPPAEGALRVNLPAGEHEIRVKRSAHAEFIETVDISTGAVVKVQAALKPLARLELLLPGRRPDDLRLTINGESQAIPNVRSWFVPVEPGMHVVRAESQRGKFEKSVTVLPNQTFTVTVAVLAESRLTGLWNGSIEIDQAAVRRKLDQAQSNPLVRGFVQQSLDTLRNGKLSLDLRPDGTYDLQMAVGPLATKGSGRWAITHEAGSRVTVELTPREGATEYRTVTFVGADVFTTELPRDLADLGAFRCQRVPGGS